MSGSDSTPPSRPQPPRDCTAVDFATQISSPKPAVVGRLNVGDVLDVEAQTYQERTVLVLTSQSEIVGGLASAQAAKILECIGDGHRFVADVESVTAGQVRIRVHHI